MVFLLVGGEWVLDGMGVVLWVGGWLVNGFWMEWGCFIGGLVLAF